MLYATTAFAGNSIAPTIYDYSADKLQTIGGNSLIAPRIMSSVRYSVLAGYTKNESILNELSVNNQLTECIYQIIQCESGFDPKAKNPNSTAFGLGQFLNSTWNYCQKKWDMKLQRDNQEDQFYALYRLLKEEGLSHWKESQKCWYRACRQINYPNGI